MRCMQCGREITDGAEFCQYCGQSVTGGARLLQQQEQVKSGMTAGTAVAIVICVIVVASIVSAAVLYVMTQGFEVPRAITPSVHYSKTSILDGVQVNIVAITHYDVPWSDVIIVLTDGADYSEWDPMTSDLDGGVAVTHDYGTDTMWHLTVRCDVSDVSGNGYVDAGDFMRVIAIDGTSFSSEITYSFFLVYEPTAEKMGTITFAG